MKKSIYVSFHVCLIILCSSACSKNDSPKSAEITSIVPTAAKGGDTVSIFGRNLTQNTPEVFINKKVATVLEATPQHIKLIIPSLSGSGAVSLKMGNDIISGPLFEYDYKATVTTIAGNGKPGHRDGTALAAEFYNPRDLVVDEHNNLYIADSYNRRIRKLSQTNNTVETYTIPFFPDNRFGSPYNIAIDRHTQNIYVTDFGTSVLRMDPSGKMTIFYNGPNTLAGIAVAPDGTSIFISNYFTGKIVKLDINGSNLTPVAEGLMIPRNLVFNNEGQLFVAGCPTPIFKINPNGRYSGWGLAAETFKGWDIAVDKEGNFYLADHLNNTIWLIEKSGATKVIAGSGEAADIDGIGLEAAFDGSAGITVDEKGAIYVTTFNYATRSGNKIRKIVLE